jgi:hypothetical protein
LHDHALRVARKILPAASRDCRLVSPFRWATMPEHGGFYPYDPSRLQTPAALRR